MPSPRLPKERENFKNLRLEELTKIRAVVNGSAGFELLEVTRYKPEGRVAGFAIRGEVPGLSQTQINQKLKQIEEMLKPTRIYYGLCVKIENGFYLSLEE